MRWESLVSTEVPGGWSEWLQLATSAATLAGILLAAVFFPLNERKKRSAERALLADRISDRFRSFMMLQIEHPRLGLLAEERADVSNSLTAEDRLRQRVIFEFLLAIGEDAYYLANSDKDQFGEWKAWDAWFKLYFLNPNFVRVWGALNEANIQSAYGRSYLRELQRIELEVNPNKF
jgi:hypothetical protein